MFTVLEQFLNDELYIQISQNDLYLTPELDKLFSNYKIDSTYYGMCRKIQKDIGMYPAIGLHHGKDDSWGWSIEIYLRYNYMPVNMFLDIVCPNRLTETIKEEEIENIFG